MSDAWRLESLTDSVNNVTTWIYDALGRVKQEINQLGASRYFEYDAAGRLDKRTDRLGRVIEFDYNTLDQVTEERWKVGTELVRTLTHEYDDAGQLELAGDPAATYDYIPDRLGRTTSETQTIAGLSVPIQYVSHYNKASSRDELTTSVGTSADFHNVYGYDHLQRLTSLTQTGGSTAAKKIDFAYNAAGQFDRITRFADAAGTEHVASTYYDYDKLGRLKTLLHTTATSTPLPLTGSDWGTGALAGYKYTYDAASRIDTITSMLDGLTDYGYDHTNQLTGADHASQDDESYSYDLNGNRTMTGYETGQNNLIQSDGTYSYIYDLEGNRIRKTEIATGKYTVYQYDHRNRLVRVEDIDPTQGYLEDWGWGNSNASYTYEESHEELDPLGDSQGVMSPCNEFECNELWAGVTWVFEPGSPSVQTSWAWGNDLGLSVDSWSEGSSCDPEPGAPCSITVHVSAGGAEMTLEGRIYDQADATYHTVTTSTSYSASVSPAIEGSEVLLTVDGAYEYYVEDVSTVHGVDYTDPNNTLGGNWTPYYWGQIAFPTSNIADWQGTRSFKIYVRLLDHPDVVWELEADIYDTLEAIVQTVDYAYDINNQMVRRRFDDDGPFEPLQQADTYFSWENGQINLQFDGTSTAPSHRYLWNPVAIDQILADENALNEVVWPLTDHLGTTRDLATYNVGTTTRVSHRVFDSFGILTDSGNSSFQIAFGFTGVYSDTATGYNFHRARWYDPATGVWLSQDPIGFAAGDSNLNRYVANSPVHNLDPDGLQLVALNIHYFFQHIQRDPSDTVRWEVLRIFEDLARRFSPKDATGKPCNRVSVMWIRANNQKEYDALKDVNNEVHFGQKQKDFGNRVTFGLEDWYSGPGEGQALGGYEANLKGKELTNDFQIAAAIAHELGLHGITGKADHFHYDSVYIDSAYTSSSLGRVFSDDAGRLIANKIGLDKKC